MPKLMVQQLLVPDVLLLRSILLLEKDHLLLVQPLDVLLLHIHHRDRLRSVPFRRRRCCIDC